MRTIIKSIVGAIALSLTLVSVAQPAKVPASVKVPAKVEKKFNFNYIKN
jgi:hypothetical protein